MILSYFTLVFGELVPKKIGLSYPDKIAYFMVDVIWIIILLFNPFVIILKTSTNIIEKILKIKKKEEHIEDQLKDTIVDSNLEELEKKLLLNVFEFNDVTVKDIMTKKENVVYIDVTDTHEVVANKIRKSKYTRFPVMKEDKILGIVNIKDIILDSDKNKKYSVYKYLRKVEKLDSKTIIDDAFLLLNSNYEAMAIVKENNEYIGIVTVEDILEHIVGNVFDEYDVGNNK